MDLRSVMTQLKAWEHPKMRAVNAKHGAGDNQFGVNLSTLRGLAGTIKRDHALALELWKSGNIDAMNLATLIMDPKQLTQPEVERLAKDLSYYTTTDWFVKNAVKASTRPPLMLLILHDMLRDRGFKGRGAHAAPVHRRSQADADARRVLAAATA